MVLAHVNSLHAQNHDFCLGLQEIISSASMRFKDVKDTVLKANEYAIMWDVKKQLPGALKCRLVSSMGIRYEAAMYQSKDLENLKETYKILHVALSDCLVKQGYKIASADNFYSGLGEFKKYMYTRQQISDSAEVAPPHVSMEADYFKGTGTYSIIIDVWEH
jgi:hypothetical protein